MNYTGVIIEESLKNKDVLNDVQIVSTKVEPITKEHKTPWLKQWTLHTVEIPSEKAEVVADKISKSLDDKGWYADFKNNKYHFIIFPNKIFKIDRSKSKQYQAATDYGLTLGIPDYQLDFSPHIIEWQRPKN